MLCFIPLPTGRAIPREVYSNLAMQTIDLNIMPCVTDGVLKRVGNTKLGVLVITDIGTVAP